MLERTAGNYSCCQSSPVVPLCHLLKGQGLTCDLHLTPSRSARSCASIVNFKQRADGNLVCSQDLKAHAIRDSFPTRSNHVAPVQKDPASSSESSLTNFMCAPLSQLKLKASKRDGEARMLWDYGSMAMETDP
jgi:hypothetical protein